jgi:gamma-glutamyltranspeptidase/glutathione hydrolase
MASLFLGDNDEPHPPGSSFRQPVLGKTLRRLARDGFEDFYLGGIATEICRDIETNGGFVAQEDLARALKVEETTPLRTTFWGDDVFTLGPPAGGLALLQMLRMASFVDPNELDMSSGEGVSRVAAIISRARSDRKKFRLRTLADGAGDAAELLGDDYARRAVGEALGYVGAADAVAQGTAYGEGETTHLCVIDDAGNVVALTQSIERTFGAAVATPGLGFLYNGYLRGFKVENERHPHYLRPGAPARSNAAPTIVLRQGRPYACLGSTGSERMTSGIFEVLLRLRDSSAFDAVHAPRLHCTPERHVRWEEERFPKGFRDTLLAHGFTVEALEPYSFAAGGLQLAVRRDGQSIGVADPRRDGAAGAPVAIR